MESYTRKSKYECPYVPEGRVVLYVPDTNIFMIEAKEYALKYCTKIRQPCAAVIIQNENVVGVGSIGNNPKHSVGCERELFNMPTGVGYEICEGCDPKFHSEISAIRDALSKGNDIKNADLYLWGHWWCCKDCWQTMIKAGIKDVYLLENSEILFNKKDPNNIIGHQFDKKE